jgi:hypothetical protein
MTAEVHPLRAFAESNPPERVLTLIRWIHLCGGHPEFVANYDRLRGTNLSRKGSAFDMAIDDATGRMESEVAGFVEFCIDLFQRIPQKESP